MKQTVLHQKHLQLKAKMTDFQGWQVPQSYTDALAEYQAVRTGAGLFDISFLGRIEISGPDAVPLLETVFTRNIAKIAPGSAHYGFICNEAGGVLDDPVLFRLPDTQDGARFLLSTNSGNAGKILSWLKQHAGSDVIIADRTESMAQLSIQGPQSPKLLETVIGSPVKRFRPGILKELSVLDETVPISRIGHSGEHGYEFFIPAEKAGLFWEAMMNAGKELTILPCGTASSDLLRLEMGYLQYGNDLDETRNPLEAGFDSFVNFKKNFIGKEALLKIKTEGTKMRLAGFVLDDKSIPRTGSSIFSENREIGTVTSGNISPFLRKGIGLGYVFTRYAQPGQEIEIESRDREIVAKIVELPFYRKK